MAEANQDAVESRVVFGSGDRNFSVRDVIDAAHFRGEVAASWKNFLREIAVEEKADEAGQEADDEAIDTAAERFRYNHDLITAEETEKWLAERGLSLGDFSSYFVRRYWSETAEDDGATDAADYLAAPEDLRALFTMELTFSGELDGMAQRLSWRVAAKAAAKEEADAQIFAVAEANFRERQGLPESEENDWLGKLGRNEEWLRAQIAMEAIYHRACAALLSPEARAREISALRLPLTNFEVETLEFDSLDAAREGLLCVQQDGMTMEEVASEGRYPYRHTEVLLEDVPEDLQQKFLSVTPGETLEPITHGEGFHLCRIIGKAEPNLEDPMVKERAEDRILDRHFAELCSNHIQWRRVLP
ncbi:MAG: hypothetical protein H0X40_03560 [Chthoniobacterales bacterium]|nr:hypothetical protein [Chthoniobacterales bacterium]